jgi:hypothetical protein
VITKHTEQTVTLHDGTRDHTIKHDDFVPMQPHAKGGIHPGVTEEHQGWLVVARDADFATCPIKPVTVQHPDLIREGRTVTATYLPIPAYLQAHYGPDNQIVTVPINGDAMAQRLHWIKRTPEEQRTMKALLKWMDAWRLLEDGSLPGPDETTGLVDHREAARPMAERGDK